MIDTSSNGSNFKWSAGNGNAVQLLEHENEIMKWPRAFLRGMVIVAVAIVLLVVIPDLILSQITGVERSGRVALATGWFIFSLAGLIWGLRRLQSRRVI